MTVRRPYSAALASAVLALSAVTAAAPSAAVAQTAEAEAGAPDEAPGEEAEDGAGEAIQPSNAPFMKPLSRLSMILGSVHFLRTLCGDANSGVYRQKMSDLIEAQSPNEFDRRLLIASFNRGYRGFESTYRECTPAARVAVNRYTAEGAALAREIGARYGN